MSEKIKRTKLNRTLLILYILLVLVLPMISLFASFSVYEHLDVWNTFLGKAAVPLYVFVSLPVYAVYANIIIKELFPTKLKQVFFLFIPIITTYAIHTVDKGFEGFWEFLILNSLPLYLGLNFVFIIGLAFLIIEKASSDSFGMVIGKVIATIIIMLLIFTAPLHFFAMGIEANSVDQYGNDEAKSIAVFVFTILLMAFFHYKIVIKLYDKGML